MFPRKIFENLHAAMAILVFFLINFTQILFRFFDSNFECFAKYDAFCSLIFDYTCLRRKAYCYGRGSKLCKTVCTKTLMKMAGGRMYTPHPIPQDLPEAISCRNHQKSLAYFNHLTPFVLFLFTKKQSQRGGGAWHKYANAARSSSCNYSCQNMAVISDRGNVANNFVSM